jgi:hypothetical protein
MFDVLEPPRILLSSILPTIKRIKPNDCVIPNRTDIFRRDINSNNDDNSNDNDNDNIKTVSAKTENGDNEEEIGGERSTEHGVERGSERGSERGGDRSPNTEESTGEMIINFEGL